MTGRTRVAILGFGRLGRACAEAVRDHGRLELVGVVRREPAAAVPSAHAPVVAHVRDLERVEAVLVCVPPGESEPLARELLQQRFAVVECAQIEPEARDDYYDTLADVARRHRAKIVLGAGWDPGVFTMLSGAFEILVPKGQTRFTRRPAVSLHHTVAAQGASGVAGALAVEHRGADGALHRYVYVELARGGKLEPVVASILADPAFAGEPTQVFPVESIAALEEEGHGVLLERLGTAASGAHQSLLLEVRGDPAALAARAMADAASRLPALTVGGHRYHLAV